MSPLSPTPDTAASKAFLDYARHRCFPACLLIVAGAIPPPRSSTLLSMIFFSAGVAHTHEVLAALEEVITTVTEAETGQRGYVITEQDLYLSEVDGLRRERGGIG